MHREQTPSAGPYEKRRKESTLRAVHPKATNEDPRPASSAAETDRLIALRQALDAFAHERDWRQFHSPRNLAACLSVEASELLELYLWTRDGDGPHPPGAGPPDPRRVREEIGDVLLSLLNFCIVAGVDPLSAAEEKLAALSLKYPVALTRGSAVKSPGLTAKPPTHAPEPEEPA